MKIIAELMNADWLNQKLNVDIWIVGLKDHSFNCSSEYSVEELKNLLKLKSQIPIALNLEKIYHNEDYEKLEKVFQTILIDKFDYFFYSDFGMYYFLKEHNLAQKAIYHCSTMLTNYYDLEYALNENANVVLGKELSLVEITEIDAKLSRKIMIDAFGKFPIFYSKRNLLSLYFTYRDLSYNPKDNDYSLIEETRTEAYPICEKDGTIIFENKYYYFGLELLKFKNIEYALILGGFLTEAEYLEILSLHYQMYQTGLNIDSKINDIVPTYQGKLTTKTVIRKAKADDEEN